MKACVSVSILMPNETNTQNRVSLVPISGRSFQSHIPFWDRQVAHCGASRKELWRDLKLNMTVHCVVNKQINSGSKSHPHAVSSDGSLRNLVGQLLKTAAAPHVGQARHTERFSSLMKLLSMSCMLYNQNKLLPLKSQYTSFFILKKKRKKRLVSNGTVRTS